ncbi:hypothetical protein O181_046982 [Austropuccinia psidii MF-1]|uniref:JmjC domain-containing protein n=1 Tax=Austropuccinia psidii MF-1 TaxID=1389203 RepID=A0A9Q3HK76_9BASI|nr:hypothetical protein [Austropuccinia psidii MF-1]
MNDGETSLRQLILEYQALNDAVINEIHDRIPTALELSRMIASNRPLVIRSYNQLQKSRSMQDSDGFHAMKAFDNWSESYLIERLGSQLITIARTPAGNADSTVDGIFVEPAYEKMTMTDFLNELRQPADYINNLAPIQKDVVYLQYQDGNLTKELLPLLPDIGPNLPIASQALGADRPDAVNIWIGDKRSTTSLHNDPYENFYLVIQGSKTFILFPPVEHYCMHEAFYPRGQYFKDRDSKTWLIETPKSQTATKVLWTPVDPIQPNYNQFPRFKFARPLTVTLREGDLLYLPSLWYHHVSQRESQPNGLVIACNWWYDMNYGGSAFAFADYSRRQVSSLNSDDNKKGLANYL